MRTRMPARTAEIASGLERGRRTRLRRRRARAGGRAGRDRAPRPAAAARRAGRPARTRGPARRAGATSSGEQRRAAARTTAGRRARGRRVRRDARAHPPASAIASCSVRGVPSDSRMPRPRGSAGSRAAASPPSIATLSARSVTRSESRRVALASTASRITPAGRWVHRMRCRPSERPRAARSPNTSCSSGLAETTAANSSTTIDEPREDAGAAGRRSTGPRRRPAPARDAAARRAGSRSRAGCAGRRGRSACASTCGSTGERRERRPALEVDEQERDLVGRCGRRPSRGPRRRAARSCPTRRPGDHGVRALGDEVDDDRSRRHRGRSARRASRRPDGASGSSSASATRAGSRSPAGRRPRASARDAQLARAADASARVRASRQQRRAGSRRCRVARDPRRRPAAIRMPQPSAQVGLAVRPGDDDRLVVALARPRTGPDRRSRTACGSCSRPGLAGRCRERRRRPARAAPRAAARRARATAAAERRAARRCRSRRARRRRPARRGARPPRLARRASAAATSSGASSGSVAAQHHAPGASCRAPRRTGTGPPALTPHPATASAVRRSSRSPLAPVRLGDAPARCARAPRGTARARAARARRRPTPPVDEAADRDDRAEDREQEAVDRLRQHPEREGDHDGRERRDEREARSRGRRRRRGQGDAFGGRGGQHGASPPHPGAPDRGDHRIRGPRCAPGGPGTASRRQLTTKNCSPTSMRVPRTTKYRRPGSQRRGSASGWRTIEPLVE